MWGKVSKPGKEKHWGEAFSLTAEDTVSRDPRKALKERRSEKVK